MSDSGSGSDSDSGSDLLYGKQLFTITKTKLPPEAISTLITSTKDRIATLLQKPNDSNLDSVIQEQMTVNNIEFNPNDPNEQNQLDQLRALLTQLQKEKKGGKKHKSKRYRKSRKQRKTKTKRRLRRSYKYK